MSNPCLVLLIALCADALHVYAQYVGAFRARVLGVSAWHDDDFNVYYEYLNSQYTNFYYVFVLYRQYCPYDDYDSKINHIYAHSFYHAYTNSYHWNFCHCYFLNPSYYSNCYTAQIFPVSGICCYL